MDCFGEDEGFAAQGELSGACRQRRHHTAPRHLPSFENKMRGWPATGWCRDGSHLESEAILLAAFIGGWSLYPVGVDYFTEYGTRLSLIMVVVRVG